MFVLDCPSYADTKAGEYLTGPNGAAFERLISRAGLSRANVLITSIINEALPNGTVNWIFDTKGIVRSDAGMLLMKNLMRLKREIEEHQPHVIVAMGNYALQLLAGKGEWNKRKKKDKYTKESEIIGWTGITDWRGSILDGVGVFEGRKIVAMQPIEAIQNQWRLHAFWLSDMMRVVEQSTSPVIKRHPRKLLIDPPREEWDSLREQLLASPDPIAFDIEHYNGRLLCIGFCAHEAWSLTISNTGPEAIDFYRSILESGHALSAQNAMFDCGVLEWHEGIHTIEYLTYDTILAAHAAHIELPKDLGTLCSLYTEEPCYWDKSDWGGLGTTWSFADMLKYNCLDAWVTHCVRAGQLQYDLVDPAADATFKFELELLQPLWDISKRGVLWSQEQLQKVRDETMQELAVVQRMLDAMYPEYGGLNVSSPKQIANLLYDKLGVPEALGQRGTTARSTNDLVLASISLIPKFREGAVGGTISLIRKARSCRSLISKFSGDGSEDSGIELDDDGRFRSTYVPSATDTGRLSAKIFFPTGKGANAQNQPRLKPVRRCFIPDPGHVIGYNDLERAESFVVAKITGDKTMLEHHLPGRNAHRLLGTSLFNKAPEELNDEEYYLSKKTRHAGNYMQGWKTFMDNVNKEAEKTGFVIDAKLAKALIYTYREMHPGLGRWWKAVEYRMKSERKLFNLFGRPRTFYGRVDSEIPAGIAFIPQSTVGDCMNYGILNLWRAGVMPHKIQGLMQIHDALVYQFPYTDDTEMMALLREVREHMLIPITNPLDGEVFTINTMPAISHVSWGDCKELSAKELGL